MENQGLARYNAFNDLFLEIISLKNRAAGGPLDLVKNHLFQRALYDLDAFRDQVLRQGRAEYRMLGAAEWERIKTDDEALLQVAHAYVEKALFSDGTHK